MSLWRQVNGVLKVAVVQCCNVPRCCTWYRLQLLNCAAAMEQGLLPLHIAAVETNVQTMKLLLEAGADVQAKDSEVSLTDIQSSCQDVRSAGSY